MRSARKIDLFKELTLKTFFGKVRLIVIFIVVALISISSVSAVASAKDTIVLKSVTPFPRNNPFNLLCIPEFIKMVERKSNGQLKINWLGGPEVIQTFDQAGSLKRGTVDMILFFPFGYLKPYIPWAQARELTRFLPWEEREIGLFDRWDEVIREKVNAKNLGSPSSVAGIRVFSNRKITKIDDFKGLKIRTMPAYTPFIEALGANAITMPPTEIYTAVQRGVVDAFCWADYALPGWGWQEVTKYRISPPFFQILAASLVNLDKFNSLPKELQAVLENSMEVMEGIAVTKLLMTQEDEWKVMQAAGMEELVLPPADAKKFLDLAYERTWEWIIKNAPVYGPQFKELISQK